MSIQFCELVINAPFLLVKGFLVGFMQGRGDSFDYYFHRKSKIERDTLGEFVKEVLHLDCHTHLCLPKDIVPVFRQALENVKGKINAEVLSEKDIQSASFKFSFHLYDEKATGPCKELFRRLPEGVQLVDYYPMELRANHFAGVSEYGRVNPYTFEGSGTVRGEFAGVMKFHRTISEHELGESILCSDIRLSF